MPTEIEYHCVQPGCRNMVVVGTPKCPEHTHEAAKSDRSALATLGTLAGLPGAFLCSLCTEPSPHVHETPQDVPTETGTDDHKAGVSESIHNAARAQESSRQADPAMQAVLDETLCVEDGCLKSPINDSRCEDHQLVASYTVDAVSDLRDQLAQSEETIARLELLLKSRDEAIREQSEEISKLEHARGETAITRPLTLDDLDELSARLKGNGVRNAVFDGSLYGNPLKLSLSFELTKPAREAF